MLRDRISAQDYKECQDDIQAASGIAEDIRDALLDYQVCACKLDAAVSLKLGCLHRWPSNGRYTTRVVG